MLSVRRLVSIEKTIGNYVIIQWTFDNTFDYLADREIGDWMVI